MVLLCKQKALYVKCCIIANGVMDSQGDTLHSEDIKKIFTSFNNQDNFEIYHNDLPIPEVSLLENYISTANERIGTTIVPPGSWNAVVRVDNPEIQEGLLTGEFGGVSLNNRIAPRCKGNLTGIVRYKDVADAECIIPLLISFVKRGANGYPLHVMDYDAYIKKSKDVEIKKANGGNNMAFDLLKGLKSLVQEAEASEEEEAVILKEDAETDDPVDEPVAEETSEEEAEVESDDEGETAEEEPTVKKEDTTVEDDEADSEAEEESEAEPEIEKAEDPEAEAEAAAEEEISLEERVAKLEEIVAQLTAEEEVDEEETAAEEEEVVDEDTPKITKSEKVIVEDTHVPEQANYFEMSGRDPLTGKKIRK